MKIGDYELVCHTCAGTEFEREIDLRQPPKGTKITRYDTKLWGTQFTCAQCKDWRAFIYRKEGHILKLRQRTSGIPLVVYLSVDGVREVAKYWTTQVQKLRVRARIYLMRHGNSPRSFMMEYGGVTAAAAKEFLHVAQMHLNRHDAKRQGLARLELERRYRQEAIDFYTSVIQDPQAWQRDPKMVMQARRELSALQGIAGDTGQVNLNLTDNRSQVTVYQLAIPDDGRQRLAPPAEDVKVIECQPNEAP